MKSGEYHMPGRKVLQQSDTLIEVALIDDTEQPIEWPKTATPALWWQSVASHLENTVDLNQ